MKSNGPSTDLCGTPYCSTTDAETDEPRRTRWTRPVRYDRNQLQTTPSRPNDVLNLRKFHWPNKTSRCGRDCTVLYFQEVPVMLYNLHVYVCFILQHLIVTLIKFVFLVLLFNFVMHCTISTVVVAFEINYLILFNKVKACMPLHCKRHRFAAWTWTNSICNVLQQKLKRPTKKYNLAITVDKKYRKLVPLVVTFYRKVTTWTLKSIKSLTNFTA